MVFVKVCSKRQYVCTAERNLIHSHKDDGYLTIALMLEIFHKRDANICSTSLEAESNDCSDGTIENTDLSSHVLQTTNATSSRKVNVTDKAVSFFSY
jgi:hypothetical protein